MSLLNFGHLPLLLLLLLLSRFSRVRLFVNPQVAAHQAPLSLGFSRQEHWSRLPFPSPMMKVKSASEVDQSCPTPSDPVDCSLPSFSVNGIFQAKVLEWGAIAFSEIRSQITVLAFQKQLIGSTLLLSFVAQHNSSFLLELCAMSNVGTKNVSMSLVLLNLIFVRHLCL